MGTVINTLLLILLMQIPLPKPAESSSSLCMEIAAELKQAVEDETITAAKAAKVEANCWKNFPAATIPR